MRFLLALVVCMPSLVHAQVFKNVAALLQVEGELGPAGAGMGGGVSWFDANQDGHLDLLITPSESPPILYFQKADGSGFIADEDALLPDTPPATAHGHVVFDMDGDGDMDVLLLRETENALLRNEGGTFQDVSNERLPGSGLWGISAAVGDYDGDGDDDVLIANYISGVSFPNHQCARNTLLENDGSGHFRDRALDFGLIKEGCSLAAAFTDYDNDGDLDMMVINDFGHFVVPNELYRNDGPSADGGWQFTDVSEESGFAQALYGMGMATADVNQDGFLDYFVTSIGRPLLLTGNAGGGFDDATENYGLSVPFADTGYQVTWGANFEDLNGDGWLDLFAAGGGIPAISYLGNQDDMPNIYWQGGPNPPWTVDPSAWTLESPVDNVGRSLALADFNQDGLTDIAVGHATGIVSLYQNLSETKPPLRIQLKPSATGPRGSGARITAKSGDCTRIYELNGGGSYSGTSTPQIRISLPTPCYVQEKILITLLWPSGYSEQFSATPGTSLIREEPSWLEFEGNKLVLSWEGAKKVEVSAIGALVESTKSHPDGTWSAEFVPEKGGAAAVFSIEVDGKILPVHPRKDWPVMGGVKMVAYPQQVIVNSKFTLYMRPFDSTGAAIGPDAQVSVEVGSESFDAKVQASGAYRVNLNAPNTTGAWNFTVLVDEKQVAGVQTLDVKPVVDSSQTQTTITHLYQGMGEATENDSQFLSIRVRLRDHNGAMVVSNMDDFSVLINGQEAELTNVITDGHEALILVPSALVPDQATVVTLFRGFPLANPQTAHHLAAPDDIVQHIDSKQSRCATAMTKFHADESDVATALIFLRDKHGNPLLPPITQLKASVSNAEVITDSLHAKDDYYQVQIRAGSKAGTATINVWAYGQETGVSCSITLLPAKALPEFLSEELSQIVAYPDELPADGLGTSSIRVLPRLPGGRAYGSGLQLQISSTLGEFANQSNYAGVGRYGRILKAGAMPGIATITAQVLEPEFVIKSTVTFFDVNGTGSEDSGVEGSTVEEPIVEETVPEASLPEDSGAEETPVEKPVIEEDEWDSGSELTEESPVETGTPSDLSTETAKAPDDPPTREPVSTSDGGCVIASWAPKKSPIAFFLLLLLMGGAFICHHRRRGKSHE